MKSFSLGILTLALVLFAVPVSAQSPETFYCPALSIDLERGMSDSIFSKQVTELQKFLADYYDLDESEYVTGFFGAKTQEYVIKFQSSRLLLSQGYVGAQTREAIAKACKGGNSTVSVETLSATPTSGGAPLTVKFALANLNSQTGKYTLDFGDGSRAETITGNGKKTADHKYSKAGTYTVALKKTTGLITTETKTVATATVTVTSGSLEFSVSPTSGTAPLGVKFIAKGLDTSGNAGHKIDFGDGSAEQSLRVTSGKADTSHKYESAGTYTVSLKRVAGVLGTEVTVLSTAVVTVEAVELGFSATPTSGKAPLTTRFSVEGLSYDDNTVSYFIDFGDNTEVVGVKKGKTTITHKYEKDGTYTASLKKASGSTWSQDVETLATTVVTVKKDNSGKATTIKVNFPKKGEKLVNVSGKVLGVIRWSQEYSEHPVSIYLERSQSSIDFNSVVKTIAENVEDTGKYEWMSDTSIPDGSYRIRIDVEYPANTAKGEQSAYSDVFTIKSEKLEKSVTILQPLSSNATYGLTRGNDVTFEWETENISSSAKATIELVGQQLILGTYQVVRNTANTGTYEWEIGADTKGKTIPNGLYMIKLCVKESTKEYCDTKGPVSVTNKG